MIFLWSYIFLWYRLLYKEFLSTMIKIRKPDEQQPLSRKQGINNGHKVRRQSISQERGLWLSSFVVRTMFTEGDSCMSHPMTSVQETACHFTHFHCQELIRNREFMRNRKRHAEILLLNVPWHMNTSCVPCITSWCRVHHMKCSAGWNKAEIKVARRISITSNMHMTPP